MVEDEDVADEDIQYLYTKKVRVNAEKDDDEAFSVGRPSTYSIITQPEDDDDAIFHTISNSGLLSQISGLKGFAGQFEGLATTKQAERGKPTLIYVHVSLLTKSHSQEAQCP
jgi:hypothetical protein